MAAANYKASKRPRNVGGDSVPLKFVTPGEITQQNTAGLAGNQDAAVDMFGGKEGSQPMQRRLQFT